MKPPCLPYCLLGVIVSFLLYQPSTLSAQTRDSVPIIGQVDSLSNSQLLTGYTFDEASVSAVLADSTLPKMDSTVMVYKPDPVKAIWYATLFPGLGQLYNKRYWKLPIIAAGIVGISYAINWNSKYYVAYTNAYRDISDDNPATQSYLKLIPQGYEYETSQLTTVLKNRQQKYRRSRDLSYICAVGLYLICILDAYVDAQLYDFDVTPNLSIVPTSPSEGFGGAKAVEFSLSFRY